MGFREREDQPYAEYIANTSPLRISCAVFARIKTADGRYLLLINHERMVKKGIRELSVTGGAPSTTSVGKEKIKQRFGIENSDFDKPEENDLRFTIRGYQANEAITWFLSGEDRESDLLREIHEELADETGLLTSGDLEGIQLSHAGYYSETAMSNRNETQQPTLRLSEVYDVMLPSHILKTLELAAQLDFGGEKLRFVIAEEINAGMTTEDGIVIGSVARALLEPKQTIEYFV